MTRRKAASVLGGAIVGPTLLPASRDERRDEREGAGGGPSDLTPRLRELLSLASLAPSGHNAQPWAVRLDGPSRLGIGLDPSRRLPAVDPEDREGRISLGAFLENLVVAARHHGLEAEARLAPASPTDPCLVDVALREAAPVPFPLERLRTRRTVRTGHGAEGLAAADVAALAGPFERRAAFFPRGSSEARWLEEATVEANRVQAAREEAQEELSRWIRWKDEEVRLRRDGLTPASMEITGLAGWYVRRFLTREDVLAEGFRRRGVDLVRRQLGAYGGWLAVASADGATGSLVDTGRRLQRVLLGLRDRGLAAHPMSQVLEEAPFRAEAARRLGLGGPLQLLVRVSRVDRYPDPVSPRRPVSWFVRGGAEGRSA